MSNEARWLVPALLSGSCVALAAGEKLSQRFTHESLMPYARVPLWSGLLVFLPIFLYTYGRYSWYRRARKLGALDAPLYPHTDPIFGSDFLAKVKKAFAETDLLECWHDMFLAYGRTYWVNAMGTWTVMTCDSENVKSILSTDFDAWPIGGIRQRTVLLTLGPDAIFSTNGAKWKHARAMMRPTFVRNQISDTACTDRHVDNFLTKIPRDGSAFDIQELLYKFTMDGSTDFMFGRSTSTLTNPTSEAQKFTECFDYANFAASKSGRLGWIAMFVPNKKMSDAIRYCHNFVERHVEAALAEDKAKERPYVFMNEMINSGASRSEITAQLLSMILGGRDTSASTMSSMFWELARRPDVVEKLRRDIATLGGRKPTWQELKDLKYLNFVLKETLRLWAPVATNMRLSGKDTTLPRGGGPDGMSPMFVPKNVGIRYSTYSLHRNPALFGDDANEFNPDRWESLRTSWEYIPFSGGPRICIGQQFALTQMQYLTTRFFQVFEAVDAADDKPMKQILSATISLKHGCWLSVKPAK